MFFLLLPSLVNVFNHTKCVSLSNQKCEIKLPFLMYILKITVKK